MPANQTDRDKIAKMKQIPVNALIKDKNLLFVDDSIVRGTQLRETVEFLYESGAKSVHMRSACPPIMYACKYLNFSRSNSDMELIARRVRELGVYSLIKPSSIRADEVRALAPKGLIFTGGPNSVFADGSTANFSILTEPQLWMNLGSIFANHLDIGTEIELSYNFAGNKGFMCNPCAGLRWTF